MQQFIVVGGELVAVNAMKQMASLFGLLLVACAPADGPDSDRSGRGDSPSTKPSPSVPVSAEASELIQLEEAYAKALIDKDRDFLMAFYASDWRGGNWTGFWTKSRMIGSVMDGRYVVKSMTLSDVKVRIVGQIAVVQGVDDEVSTVGGRDTSGRWAFTDVFERRGGRWVAIASHTTEMRRE